MSVLYFDLQKAQRDKSKLVYVQRTVTKNGKTFQQGFWVQPSQVKSTDTVLQGKAMLLAYQLAQKQVAQFQNQSVGNFDKSKYVAMYTSGDKTKAMQYAKANGISWNEHSNPNINWMRCQMAVNKSLGGSVTVSTSKTSSAASATLNTSGLKSDFDSLSKKDKVVELLKNNSRDSLIAFAKANGITWKETDNAGINWMRCSMALQSHLESHKLADVASTSTKQDTPPQPAPPSDTLDVPTGASPRQKALIEMVNNISKKEDFDLFGAVGMIAEDDAARKFMEEKLKPRYEEWKNGHTPSAGSSGSYGYVVNYGDDFGNGIVGDVGMFMKGLNQNILSDSLAAMYDGVSLATMLYPREFMQDDLLAGKSEDTTRHRKESQARELSTYFMIRNLNNAFSVRDTADINEFRYGGWNTDKYKKFPAETHGFVKCLEHVKKNNPELGTECDRMISVYSDMFKTVDGNQKILDLLLQTSDFSSLSNTVKSNRTTVQIHKLMEKICTENGLTPQEAYQTIRYSGSSFDSNRRTITVCDDNGYTKTDSSGNLIKIDIMDYLSKHQSEFPDLDPASGFYLSSWSNANSVKTLMEGGLPENHERTSALESLATKENFFEIRRKSMELFDVSLKPGTSGTTFDILSNDPDTWENNQLYTRDVKKNDALDAVLANLQFINASNQVCVRAQRSNGTKTRPSKANDNGDSLSKTFSYYARDGFQDWQVTNIQEKSLPISEVNQTVEKQLDAIPTFSQKWIEDSRKYVEEQGNEKFKMNSWYDDPSTELQKRHAKALSLDLGSQSAVAGYMGTPVGDLLTKQMTTMAKYCPQMETARFNTPEKIQQQVENKLGYKPFEFADPQAASGAQLSALRQQREELYRKVHCSLKSCDSIQYDAVQTEIKHNWDKGVRNSYGNRLYGHISGVFHGAYRVNNSLQEELMLANAKKLNETPQSFFHGTNHSGATGIIGVDGRFRAPKSSADASKQGLKYAGGMLGSGVYLAKMAGKSAGYFGTWGAGYNKQGCMLMCKAVLGKTYVSSGFNSSAPASYDTVSMQAGTNTGQTILRADEWCVRNPDFVFPEYIVDMETKARS